jgi:hypothetical protein
MHLYHSIQTLTTLNLGQNYITDIGAQDLISALQHNKVRLILFSHTSCVSVSLNVDTYRVDT